MLRASSHRSVVPLAILVALVLAAYPAVAGGPFKAPPASGANALNPVITCAVDPAKSLFVTEVRVVDDCWRTTWGPCPAPPAALPATRGAWTFGKLVEGLAGSTDPVRLNDFVRDWLAEWQTDQIVNGDLVPARPNIDSLIIDPWVQAGGGAKILDMKKAPFRLLAIVYRPDLRSAPAGYGTPGSAGEARFVFGVVDALDPDNTAHEFTVILEYGLDAPNGCSSVLDWAQRFANLSTLKFGDGYNAALESITQSFTAIGASPAKPNGSAINQVRSNEITLDFPWELREFRLNPRAFPAPLTQGTVAQTPDANHHGTTLISSFVNANEAAILAGTHTVPLTWSGQPFLGGAAPHSLDLGWDGPNPPPCGAITNPEARFGFSVNTCSGCHGTPDTGTFFYHVFPRLPGSPSSLSQFLTDTAFSVTDVCGRSHTFGDISRRQVDLCRLLSTPCGIATEE